MKQDNKKTPKIGKPKVSGKAAVLAAMMFLSAANGVTDEHTGYIMGVKEEALGSEPIDGTRTTYYLDTNEDELIDITLVLNNTVTSLVEILKIYLQQGGQVIYEDKYLMQGYHPNHAHIIAIITPRGRRIELNQLFTEDQIRRTFPALRDKLIAEGVMTR